MNAERLIATDLTMLDPVALQQFALDAQAALIAAAPAPQPVQGEAVFDPYGDTDVEVIRSFLSLCREAKPVGRWPGERVCLAIERLLDPPRRDFISDADKAPRREHNGRGGDADQMTSGPLYTQPPAPAVGDDVEQLREQAEAWRAVFRTLSEVSPGWMFNEDDEHRRGYELACDAIRKLAALRSQGQADAAIREVLGQLCAQYIANPGTEHDYVRCVTPKGPRLADSETGRLWLRAAALAQQANKEQS